jgi:UDP-glucose 4-epimerase
MGKAIDRGDYYQIPADNRDLNYAQYFVEGDIIVTGLEDYTSHNANRLDVNGVKNILLKLDYIKNNLQSINFT